MTINISNLQSLHHLKTVKRYLPFILFEFLFNQKITELRNNL